MLPALQPRPDSKTSVWHPLSTVGILANESRIVNVAGVEKSRKIAGRAAAWKSERTMRIERKVPRYRMYVDETGTPHISEKGIASNRYLGLSAVITECDTYSSKIVPDLNSFIKEMFGHDPDERVVLHREHILKRSGVFAALDNQAVRDKFNRGLCAFCKECPMTLICVVIDKAGHLKRYGTEGKHPYHYCGEALMERYVHFLSGAGGVGDVIAECRNPDEDHEFNMAWMRFYDTGTSQVCKQKIQSRITSRQIKFRDKKHCVHGLQIADVLAVAACNDVLISRRIKEKHGSTFDHHLSQAIYEKYRRKNKKSDPRGYGWVMLSRI